MLCEQAGVPDCGMTVTLTMTEPFGQMLFDFSSLDLSIYFFVHFAMSNINRLEGQLS